MSKNNGNCTICGGALRIAYTITFEQSRPREIRVSEVPPNFVRLCPGHFPEQDKMHDGKLDTLDDTTVSMQDDGIVRLADNNDIFFLAASQALSLLTWLLQERRQLEEIVAQVEPKEQRE